MKLAVVFATFVTLLSTGTAQDTGPVIQITPNNVLLGTPFTMHVMGLLPLQQVKVSARRVVRQDEVYSSQLSYVADAKGTIDLTSVPSDVKNQAPNKLLWSMTPEAGAKASSNRTDDLQPLLTTIMVEHQGKILATETLQQLMLGKNIVREQVREQGLVGTCFRPFEPGKYPAIIAFGGSGGGLSESREALLASQGYVVLSLAYFNFETLPKTMVELPLEYFGKAIDWIQKQEYVQKDKLAVLGTSRGGELALLLGVIYPQIKAVVAYVPSHVVWGGAPFRSAWSYQGKPVPFMSKLPDGRIAHELMRHDPGSNTPAFLLQLADKETVRQASISVEKIAGPVLLFSGEDDKLWPSAYMAEQVMERLKKHDHPFTDEHHSYSGGGHTFPLPGMPPPANRRRHRVTNQEIAYGGTVEATAYASVDSWNQLRRFLQSHLKR